MKKLYLLYISLVCLFSIPMELIAQIDPAFSRRGLNQEIYNPAYIIPENVIRADLTYRKQWAAFENSPNNVVLNVSNFIESKKFGFGVSIVDMNQGVQNYQNIKLKYAYQIWLKNDIIVSMGIGAGVLNHRLNNDQLVFENQNDPLYSENFNKITPDFDIGVSLFAKNLEAGFSMTHFVTGSDQATNYKVPRHQYAYISYLITFNSAFSLKPMVSYRGIRNLARFEVSASANYNDFLGADFGLSLNKAIFFSASIAPKDWIKVVYTFDMDAGKLLTYNANIHEIGVIFKFRKKSLLHKSPRFFD